jgi:hypothetical protein
MRWIIAVFLLGLVTALVVSFIRNARAIRRDMKRRFDALQVQLEKDANALTNALLERTDDDEAPRSK